VGFGGGKSVAIRWSIASVSRAAATKVSRAACREAIVTPAAGRVAAHWAVVGSMPPASSSPRTRFCMGDASAVPVAGGLAGPGTVASGEGFSAARALATRPPAVLLLLAPPPQQEMRSGVAAGAAGADAGAPLPACGRLPLQPGLRHVSFLALWCYVAQTGHTHWTTSERFELCGGAAAPRPTGESLRSCSVSASQMTFSKVAVALFKTCSTTSFNTIRYRVRIRRRCSRACWKCKAAQGSS